MKENIVSELFSSVKRRPEIQAVIPMGYTPGIPVLTALQEELCVAIPFLRYKVTGEKDQTLVYPVRYVATYVIPEMQLVSFVDLAYTTAAKNIDFNKSVGLFRHKAISGLSRQEYNELRARTLAGLDNCAALLLGTAYYEEDKDIRLKQDMSRIIEPSLYPFYKSNYPKFFAKYISDGKNN